MYVKNSGGKIVALALVRAIQENRDYLSEIDGLIGDGDHGANMSKGFSMFADRMADKDPGIAEAFKLLSRTLMGDIGGSMGPLYGTFFNEMSKKLRDLEHISAPEFGVALEAALEGVKSIGGAKIGDKTLVDCLEPAVAAFRQSVEGGADFREALTALKIAAEIGRDSTKDMVAKLGRSSRLGERSRGVLDAGATSCCILLCAMADAIDGMLVG